MSTLTRPSHKKEEETKNIWISPAHWKNMDSMKRAVVVAAFHSNYLHSNFFPFHKTLKDGAGIIFFSGYSDNDQLIRESTLELFKEFKIPHLYENASNVAKRAREASSRG